MTTHDDAMLDSVAALALGTLPETEAREVAAHVASCSICAREYAELRSVADAVGFDAELPAAQIDDLTSRRLKSRVMTAVLASVEHDLPGAGTTSPSRNGAPRTLTPWLPYGFAVAAALVAAVALANVASLRGERASDADRIASLSASARDADARAASLQGHLRELDARVASIVAPGSRHFPVATGEVVASRGRIVIALHDLPKLPAGRVYQAWTLAKGAKAVAPSITFTPDAAGVALVELPEGASNLAAVAVSVEPAGGSKAPTSKPAFVRVLS